MRKHVACCAVVLAIACAVAPLSCEVNHGCDAAIEWALRVRVLDAATGASICDATVTFESGQQTGMLEPLEEGEGCVYVGAGGLVGEFSVAVSVENYCAQQRDGVRVETEGCDLLTQDVVFQMSSGCEGRSTDGREEPRAELLGVRSNSCG